MAMLRAIGQWKRECHVEAQNDLKLPYTTYGCMLLLSANAFQTSQWREATSRCTSEDMEHLYKLIATHLKITHLAINRPIPPNIDQDDQRENILRAPRNFLPFWGEFGPDTCHSPLRREDFEAAFWVTAKQNGISQTWAPRWTMFSRGNISEKARLLSLPSVHSAIAQGQADGRGCTAIDLYAGIGYFAFSYLKAGISHVLCWDINPWSVEGFLRGAAANKWSVTLHMDNLSMDEVHAQALVFNESNELAKDRMQQLRDRFPPVRHVNCGLLPTSRGSWKTAFTLLDRNLGGWIHVHENLDVKEIQACSEAVKDAFQKMLDNVVPGMMVQIEDIHRVKSYAPGVMHCVIDVSIPALRPD